MYSEVPCGLIMQQIWAQYVHLSRNAPRKGTKKITVLFVLLKGTSSSDILNQKPHYPKRKCRRRSVMFQNRDFFPAFGTYSSSREEPLLALKDGREIQTLVLWPSSFPQKGLYCHTLPLFGRHCHCSGTEEIMSVPTSVHRLTIIKTDVYLQRMFHKLEPLQQEIFFSCILHCG